MTNRVVLPQEPPCNRAVAKNRKRVKVPSSAGYTLSTSQPLLLTRRSPNHRYMIIDLGDVSNYTNTRIFEELEDEIVELMSEQRWYIQDAALTDEVTGNTTTVSSARERQREQRCSNMTGETT